MSTPSRAFDQMVREADARRHGHDLFDVAEVISPATVDALAAALGRLVGKSLYWDQIAEGFAERMMGDAGARHLGGLASGGPRTPAGT